MPKVIIMGGSLGGLTAALFLREAGCAVTVSERSTTPLVGLGAALLGSAWSGGCRATLCLSFHFIQCDLP